MKIDKKQLNIAKNYAKALLKNANNNSAEFYSEFKALVEVFEKSEELKLFMKNPLISANDKKEMIYKIFGEKFDLQLINLLNLLADNKRLFLIETIFYCFENEYEKLNDISKVTIYSAIQINKENKERIQKILNQKLNCTIVPDYRIEEDIIGGLKIKISDKIIDLSLKSKIENMEKQLI